MKDLISIFRKVMDIPFPRRCRVCNSIIGEEKKGDICIGCWRNIRLIERPLCSYCGISLQISYDLPEGLNGYYICRRCRETPPEFDSARSVCHYDGILKRLIHIYKYNRVKRLGDDLLSLMINYIKSGNNIHPPPNIIMYVPLHRRRLKERGFDQSYILARGIGDYLNILLITDNLSKTRHTKPQAKLSRNERLNNIKGTFIVKRPEEIRKMNILLIDDVFTTGTTVNECAMVLKKGGAGRVDVLTLARAVRSVTYDFC
ncbi:MAG: ComF family protein [Nitrospinae bacterium]|nr:ComF family protein [Nitrospinota bacterium]